MRPHERKKEEENKENIRVSRIPRLTQSASRASLSSSVKVDRKPNQSMQEIQETVPKPAVAARRVAGENVEDRLLRGAIK